MLTWCLSPRKSELNVPHSINPDNILKGDSKAGSISSILLIKQLEYGESGLPRASAFSLKYLSGQGRGASCGRRQERLVLATSVPSVLGTIEPTHLLGSLRQFCEVGGNLSTKSLVVGLSPQHGEVTGWALAIGLREGNPQEPMCWSHGAHSAH